MNFRRLGTTLLLTALAAVTLAAPALAHTSLKSSNPANGAELAAAPSEIQLTFGEAVTLPADPIKVTGPSGAVWTVGKVSVAGAVVTAPVEAKGPAGKYTIAWKVIADDGEAVSGTVRFALSADVTPSSSAVPSSSSASSQPPSTSATAPSSAAPAAAVAETGGVPVWVWILVAVVLVAIVLGALRARKGSKSSE